MALLPLVSALDLVPPKDWDEVGERRDAGEDTDCGDVGGP